MRRSCRGRRSVSRGAFSVLKGITVSDRAMAIRFLPPVEAGDKSFGIGIRAGRQLNETIGARERSEVARTIGGAGCRPRPGKLVSFNADREKECERRVDGNRIAERDFFRNSN